MPVYHLNIVSDENFEDTEGGHFADIDAARREAVLTARQMMGDAIYRGYLPLKDEIHILNDHGELVEIVLFSQAVESH